MILQLRWFLFLVLCMAVSGLAGLGDVPAPMYDVAEVSTGLEMYAGTGIAFENCGGLDLEELYELDYIDRTHFLSLAVGMGGRIQVYKNASLEGKAFLAGPGGGFAVNWKQVLWRGKGETLALKPGFTYTTGMKNVHYEWGIDFFLPWVYREDLYGQSRVWDLPLIYSLGIQGDSLHSAMTPTLNLNARLGYVQYQVKWATKETGRPTITRDLGSHGVIMGSVSGNLRFRLGGVLVTNELGVVFVPQSDNRKPKSVFVLGLSLGVPLDQQLFR